jgi:predicted XRE-type DNA-binding protein
MRSARRKASKTKREIEPSTGNVFADLDLPAADEALAKARVAAGIGAIIRERDLTQVAAAKLLGVDQPKISAILRGQLSGFSTDRLLRFLTALGRDVEIVIGSQRRRGPGHLEVRFA